MTETTSPATQVASIGVIVEIAFTNGAKHCIELDSDRDHSTDIAQLIATAVATNGAASAGRTSPRPNRLTAPGRPAMPTREEQDAIVPGTKAAGEALVALRHVLERRYSHVIGGDIAALVRATDPATFPTNSRGRVTTAVEVFAALMRGTWTWSRERETWGPSLTNARIIGAIKAGADKVRAQAEAGADVLDRSRRLGR